VLVSWSPARLPQWQADCWPSKAAGSLNPGQPAVSRPIRSARWPPMPAADRLARGAAGEQVTNLAEIYEQALPSRPGARPEGHNAKAALFYGEWACGSAQPQASPAEPAERPDLPSAHRMERPAAVSPFTPPAKPVANLTYFGPLRPAARGQESAASPCSTAPRFRLHRHGLVSQGVDQDVPERMPGTWRSATTASTTRAEQGLQCPARGLMPAWAPSPGQQRQSWSTPPSAQLLDPTSAGEFTSTTDSELIAFALQEAVDGVWLEAAIKARQASAVVPSAGNPVRRKGCLRA